jgi:hypothetical protein
LAQGLIRPVNIPSTWLGSCEPDPSDFHHLLAREFRHLISAHSEPLLYDARARLSRRAAEILEKL